MYPRLINVAAAQRSGQQRLKISRWSNPSCTLASGKLVLQKINHKLKNRRAAPWCFFVEALFCRRHLFIFIYWFFFSSLSSDSSWENFFHLHRGRSFLNELFRLLSSSRLFVNHRSLTSGGREKISGLPPAETRPFLRNAYLLSFSGGKTNYKAANYFRINIETLRNHHPRD